MKKAGYEIVDTASETPVLDQVEKILGSRWVDGGVDCVGLECHGYGPKGTANEEEAVINMLMEVVKPGGSLGIPGVYTDQDPSAPTELAKQGKLPWSFPKAWVKSPSITAGQCPVMRYNQDLMMAILWDRMINPDTLRMLPEAMAFAKAFFDSNKPVAAICHGPWTVIEVGAARGRRIASWPSLKTDLRNAGADWVDQEVVVDRGLVTSRKPDDIPAFNREMIKLFARGRAKRSV